MRYLSWLNLVLFFSLLLQPIMLRAEDAAPSAETRMRTVLRDTISQLREAQNQVVTLQAAQTQSDKDKADLQAKVDSLTAQIKTVTDQAMADKASSDKSLEELNAKVTDQSGQIDRLTEGLKQWKTAYDQSAQLAASKDAEAKQFAVQAALMKRTVDDREVKNLTLFKIANEILDRYERFGLGDALAAKEPFIGTSKVRLENQVQDYKNKILDQAVTTKSGTAAVVATPSAGSGGKNANSYTKSQ